MHEASWLLAPTRWADYDVHCHVRRHDSRWRSDFEVDDDAESNPPAMRNWNQLKRGATVSAGSPTEEERDRLAKEACVAHPHYTSFCERGVLFVLCHHVVWCDFSHFPSLSLVCRSCVYVCVVSVFVFVFAV